MAGEQKKFGEAAFSIEFTTDRRNGKPLILSVEEVDPASVTEEADAKRKDFEKQTGIDITATLTRKADPKP